MATFEAYERQLTDIIDGLSRGCKAVDTSAGGEARQRLQELRRGIEDAESLVRQMDLEARSLPASDRGHLLVRLRGHKVQLLTAKGRVKELSGGAVEGGAGGGRGGVRAGEERAALMDEDRDYVPLSVSAFTLELAQKGRVKELASENAVDGAVGGGGAKGGGRGRVRAGEERAALMDEDRDYVPLSDAADQRSRLLQATARLGESSARVEESRRSMAQTEQLGVTILHDLHQQRQSLLRAGETLEDVDHQMSRARRVLTAMSHKLHRNKWITALILLLLLAAIAAVIYLKLRH